LASQRSERGFAEGVGGAEELADHGEEQVGFLGPGGDGVDAGGGEVRDALAGVGAPAGLGELLEALGAVLDLGADALADGWLL